MRSRVDLPRNESTTDFGREMNGHATRPTLKDVLRRRSAQTARADVIRYHLSMGLVGYLGGLVLVVPVVVYLAGVRPDGVRDSLGDASLGGTFRSDASGPSLISVPTLVGRDLALPVPSSIPATIVGAQARFAPQSPAADANAATRDDHAASSGPAIRTEAGETPIGTSSTDVPRASAPRPAGPEPRDIAPTAAEPGVAAPVATQSEPEADLVAETDALANAMLIEARELVRSGAILEARRALTAPELADRGEALFMLAETYDPNVLAAIGAIGVAAEADRARRHYASARDRGVTAAASRLEALE